MRLIELRNIVKRYGEVTALDNVNLQVEKSEILAVVGPNGAGKTTLLKVMAGLEAPTRGEIFYKDKEIGKNDLEFLRRRCTMVFQRTVLFDTTVYNNVAYGLKIRKLPKKEIENRVSEALKLVKLEGYDRFSTKNLSGGQQQQVSLARALVLKPELLLLDEPTANLDPETSSIIEDVILQINRDNEMTVVMATHNIFQAQRIPSKAALLLDGKISEVGPVEELFLKPSVNLASFTRLENVFAGTAKILEDGTSLVEIDDKVKVEVAFRKKGKTTIFIRPEDIIISKKPLESSARNVFRGKIIEVSDLGSLVKLKVDVGRTFTVQVTKSSFKKIGLNIGSVIFLTFKASSVHLT